MDHLWHLFEISQLDFSQLPEGIKKGYFTAMIYYFVYRSLLEGNGTRLRASDRSLVRTHLQEIPETDDILPMPPGFIERFDEMISLDPILADIVEKIETTASSGAVYQLYRPEGLTWEQLTNLKSRINTAIEEGLSIVPFDVRTILLIERTALENFGFDLQMGRV